MKLIINGKEFVLRPNADGALMLMRWVPRSGRGISSFEPARLTDLPITLEARVTPQPTLDLE